MAEKRPKELSERLNLMLAPEEMTKLEALAAANAQNNKSLMVRQLIDLAITKRHELNLHAPNFSQVKHRTPA